MDKKKDEEQPDPITKSIETIAAIRAKVRGNPELARDIEREIAEREDARLASRPAPAEKKPVRKVPPGARAHDAHARFLLGKDFE